MDVSSTIYYSDKVDDLDDIFPTSSFFDLSVIRIYTFITFFTIGNVAIVNLIDQYILQPILDPIDGRVGVGNLGSLATGLTQSVLFSIGPTVFKTLAGMEGSSTSTQKVEQKALIFFWYFYIIGRLMGPIVWDAFSQIFSSPGEYFRCLHHPFHAMLWKSPLLLS